MPQSNKFDIYEAIKKFENDPTFFLEHRLELHKPLLEIAKNSKPNTWLDQIPVWIVPEKLIGDAIAVAPHRLVFISDSASKDDWGKIVKHELAEIRFVEEGYSPEKAHKLAQKATFS